jgi:putative oxidoreductase
MINSLNEFLGRWSSQILSIMRIAIAFLFMAHGTQTLFGYPASGEFAGVNLFSWTGLAGVLETFGGLAVLVGIFTRPIALILSVEMAVVYLTTYASANVWPRLNGGDLAFFYCFLFLYLAVAGGGPWSLDARLRGKTRAPTDSFARWEPQLRSILRVVVTFLFVTHGTEDLFGWPWDPNGPPFPGPGPGLAGLQGVAHVIEVIGGPLLLLGLLTKPVAFIFSGQMAIAYFYSHQPRTFWPILNGGEDAVFFSFTFLYLAAVGGGPWALDRLQRWGAKRHEQSPTEPAG